MKFVVSALAAVLACSIPFGALSAEAANADSAKVEQWRAAMKTARWTGPMLASNAETLPRGHAYTEPYFYDVIVGGDHHPGSSGFYQYGLLDALTVGVQPSFATATNRLDRGMAIGDFKLLSQLRLTHFTPEHRIPTIAIVLNEVLPTGKDDRLGPNQEGHGSGSFATEVGVNVQHYFLLKNDRLLRARINVLQSFAHGSEVVDRSVYGTAVGFRGRAHPGSKTTLIAAVEYSVTREWVLAFDVIHESTSKARLRGRYGSDPLVNQTFPSGWSTGFAPAVEYNWSNRTGILFGIWISPKGHNTVSSVTPALAFSRFW